MCGRVIQSSAAPRYAIVDGMNVRDSRLHNHPPRWNAAPSQDLLVIRRNHQTGAISLDPLRWVERVSKLYRLLVLTSTGSWLGDANKVSPVRRLS